MKRAIESRAWLAALACLVACEPVPEADPPAVVQISSTSVEPVAEAQGPSSGLEERVSALEERVAQLESGGEAESTQDREAEQLFKSMKGALKSGDYAQARELGERLADDYSHTDGYKKSKRWASELALFDQPAPVDAGAHIERWLTPAPALAQSSDLGWSKGAHLVVFWEHWSGISRTHMPQLQSRYETWQSRGLKVVALTRVNRSDTVERVAEFIQAEGLTLPIAHEDGTLARAFKVQALPAAAVILDGKIVWRGDPRQLTDTALARWVQ